MPRQRPVAEQPSFVNLWNMPGEGKLIPSPCQQDIDVCPFGTKFASRVKSWWDKLQWFVGPPVSVVEIYFDFCIDTQSQVPVRMPGNIWKLREDSVEADVTSQRLGLQNHAWLKFLRWWCGKLQCPELQICRCNSLFTYGPTVTSWGFNLRPKLVQGEKVSMEVWKYLHSGGKTRRNFKSPWCPRMG